jgi:hypothetical protein
MIHTFCDKHQTNWDIVLPIVLHCYRTTVNPITGYSPYFLQHGREARQPSEDWMSYYADSNRSTANIHEWVSSLQETFASAWQAAAENRVDDQERRDNQKNKTALMAADPNYHPRSATPRKYRPFAVGDEFFLKAIPHRRYRDEKSNEYHKLSLKLQHRYTGPHQVIQVINPIVFKCNINGKYRNIHALRMKRSTQPVPVNRKLNPVILRKPDRIQEIIRGVSNDMPDDLASTETSVSSEPSASINAAIIQDIRYSIRPDDVLSKHREQHRHSSFSDLWLNYPADTDSD